ncbi:acyl-CoA dehydrogenase family protein [Mesonia aquimarina]|uniref:acyl-CoA dehydrogenase n=1 Tax=Mesonia aquimarina TaxID=1504967 RepID=UPI0013CF1AC3|nr:acyl-CoA dehydrogenase [Mesonia aquimarina]
MNKINNRQTLRDLKAGQDTFPSSVLDWIARENLWNIWVPKKYGGLESSLTEGLAKLQGLAQIDGSLGWCVTLCSGANYFVGNLSPARAASIFSEKPNNVCFGGSGAVSGIAEKRGDAYEISGTWSYATGAPYLSHFTLNAEIYENGKPIHHSDGSPKVLSFVLPKSAVSIIEDWQSMGLKASATHSFQVEKVLVHQEASFVYDQFYQPHPIFKIPFAVFADLTLWVNYIGMATHFMEAGKGLKTGNLWGDLEPQLHQVNQQVKMYADQVEEYITKEQDISGEMMNTIHHQASHSVKELTHSLISVYPHLGVKASRTDQEIHQIFCDYFTATQHHIFTK